MNRDRTGLVTQFGLIANDTQGTPYEQSAFVEDHELLAKSNSEQ